MVVWFAAGREEGSEQREVRNRGWTSGGLHYQNQSSVLAVLPNMETVKSAPAKQLDFKGPIGRSAPLPGGRG